MKPYKTIRQFQERITLIQKQHYYKFLTRDPEPKDIILFMKRLQLCQNGLKRLTGVAIRINPEEGSLKYWMDIHNMLAAEILKPTTLSGSWELRVLDKQLTTVSGVIRALKIDPERPTFSQKIKVALERFKMPQIFTVFTNY